MYWLPRNGEGVGRVSTRDACGLLSGHTLIALASDLARLRLLCCGVACCDGSSVEISITQANDKCTCCRKFSRLLSGRPRASIMKTHRKPPTKCVCVGVCRGGRVTHSHVL